MIQAEILFNEQEALRYFRAAPDDTQAQEAVRQAYAQLKNELQPRYTVRKFGCCIYTEDELLRLRPQVAGVLSERKRDRGNSFTAQGNLAANETQPAIVLLSHDTLFYSRALARYLSKCRELYLFGATLGSRVDIALRRLSLGSVTQGAAAQAVAAALIETYCDACCEELQQQLPAGKRLKMRFSPGYGDWKLEEQRILFSVLDCAHTIGLTLTESCMMAPIKSVTAVIGIEECEKDSIHDPTVACYSCGKTDCEFRRR